jgi:hypothetical protein
MGMKFVCSSVDKTWFSMESEHEAAQESVLMDHAVEKYFCAAHARAKASYAPGPGIERDIGLKAHIERNMPLFLTLRDGEGNGLATAMLPPGSAPDSSFPCIVVGPKNTDPYPQHADAIEALAQKFQISLPRQRCYPYA